MYSIFLWGFFWRAYGKAYLFARIRAAIYAVCGVIIIAAIILLLIDHIFKGTISSKIDCFIFYGEATALVAFGIAWLTASHMFWIFTNSNDKIKLSPFIDIEEKS